MIQKLHHFAKSTRAQGRRTRQLRSTAFVLLLLFLSTIIALPHYDFGTHSANALTAPPTTNGLVLISRPPVLPADGGSYNAIVLEFKNLTSGTPIVPQANVTVYMSSSNLQVGTVSSSITFPAGSLFTTAAFQTTSSPGNTTITAFASGYQTANLIVATRKVGGMPSALTVSVSPSQIPPDKRFNSVVIVQAVDNFGNPVKLASGLSVTLSTSNSQVGSISNSLVIPAGSSFAETTFSASYLVGQTMITASAAGYSTGSSTVSTFGPIPRRLVVSVAPAMLLASLSETATVSIQLQDNQSQTPAPAPSPVSVVLTSSNLSVAVVPSPIITIPAGSSYASVTIRSGGYPGFANITAAAQGYIKGSANLNATSSTMQRASQPNVLALYFVPDTLLPDNSTYPSAVVVALENFNPSPPQGQPQYCAAAYQTSTINVYARSSNNATMQVSTVVGVIPAKQTHTSFDIGTTFLPGIAEITAQSPGLGSTTMSLTSFGTRPNALKLDFSPSVLVSDGGTYKSVVVRMIDEGTEAPAKAPVDTVVNLATNQSLSGEIEKSVTIPSGKTYAIANFTTSGIPGAVQVTASASNYTSTNGTLVLITPAADHLKLYSTPESILADGNTYESAVIQLQDSLGDPVKTIVPVTVQLATQSSVYGSVPMYATIAPGSTFVPIEVNSTTSPGWMNITAFANGLKSGQTHVETILLPIQGKITSRVNIVTAGDAVKLTLVASSNDLPLGNASVRWIALRGGGVVQSGPNATDTNGSSTALYVINSNSTNDGYQVEALVSKPGYTSYLASLNIIVEQAPQNTSLLNIQIFTIQLWIIILAAGVIVAASVALVYVYRRHGGQGEEDEGEYGE